MPTRRAFIQTAAAAPLLAQNRQPNILLLIADDLGLHTGAYGDTYSKTPNLDSLAADGVRFENAFCTTASCSPSRSVILSGLQNHANGQYGLGHAVHNFSYLPKIRPLPSLLKDAGYTTGVIGKLHVNPIERFRWDLNESADPGRNGSVMAQKAGQFMQSAGSKPWYLHIGFTDPHRAAQGFANKDYPGIQRTPFDPQKAKVPPFLPDNTPTRQELAEYYEAVNRLDQGVGHFMSVLKKAGQLDNTLVIFLSDNGMPFPNAKTTVYDSGSRLPLIVRNPRQSKRGLVNKAMISWVDILPTCVDWAGAKLPDYPVHGRSFLNILDQENPTGWDQVFFSHTFHEVTMYYPMRGMRNRRYKYLRNLYPELSFPFASDLWNSKMWQSLRPEGDNARLGRRSARNFIHRPAEELYDITADPDELNNLAQSPQHREALAQMHKTVHEWRKTTADPWIIQSKYSGEDPSAAPPM